MPPPSRALALGALSSLTLAACGPPPRHAERTMCPIPPAAPTSGGAEARSEAPQPAAESMTLAVADVDGDADAECVLPREAPPWEPLALTLGPDEPAAVLLAELALPPGAYFRPPTSSCQDVIVLLREGELEASGTGIAPSEARASLYVGDAVRFGPEGDGLLVNASDRAARTLLAVARDARRFQRASDREDLRARGGDCAPLDRPLAASPLRVGSIATTQPLAPTPALSVRILLDADGHGAENAALSILEGSPAVRVPEHTHDGSAEILLVDEGRGTLTLGDRAIAVAAGARLYIPAGVPHAFTSDGTSPLRAVQLYAPAGPEQRFRAAPP
jgi:quercetin dioxygenase-like cupin family protein